ncbi:ABC transporter permease [Flavobacterium beibuense]|uniref:ABC transporter permease n=1 Tax=Flavobacterium beibuense TaxID=657326 RepID=UPI003A92AB5E
MLKNWIKIYLYNIRQNKLFTALNILGLSLGIAGLVFALLYSNDEYSYNAWNPNKDNVFYTVSDVGEDMLWGSSSAPLGRTLEASVPQVEEHCYVEGWYNNNVVIYEGKKTMLDKITDAQRNFFSFLPFTFIKGSAETALSPTTMAISEPTAKRIFGSQDPINKQVTYMDKVFTIKGVYRIDGKSSYEPEAVINLIDKDLDENQDRWGFFGYNLLLKLKKPEDAAYVSQQIDTLYYNNTVKKSIAESGISKEEYLERYGSTKVYLEPLRDLRLKSRVSDVPEGRGNYQLLLIMMGLSILILVISIVNYINLATANAIKRAKEVGVRKILGASKKNIVKQFIFETVITTLFSILLALVIVEVSLPYYNTFLAKNLVINESEFYIDLALLFIVVIVLAGIFPAIYVAKFEAVKVLKGNFSRSKKGIWLRNGMLVVQFAVAFFFVIGSYIVHQQIKYITTKDLGFKGAQVLDVYYRNPFDFNEEGYMEKLLNRYESTKEQLRNIKGIEQVSVSTVKIGGGGVLQSTVSYQDKTISMQLMAMDFGLPETLSFKFLEGRDLSPHIASDTIDSVILNETAVKMLNIANPVNKIINYNDSKLKVVGVVQDFHMFGPAEKILPMMLFHYNVKTWELQNCHEIYIKADPEQMESVIAGIEKLWKEKVDPDFPFSYDFVDKNFARTYEDYVRQRNVFSLLNVVVILIALFGLFALSSYSIQRRMKEIAIRKTLGAETGTLLKDLSRQYVLFCVIGFVIATIPVWILLNKWLENFVYRIEVSWQPFVVGFLSLMGLTLTVVLIRAYAATRVEILKYLKYE